MSTRYVNAMFLAIIMILVSMNSFLDYSNEEETSPVLYELIEPSEAPTNPGHTVFAQYITSDNCGYCYAYGSPAHNQAKNSLPDNYVYISYHSASYGNTADAEAGNIAPIYGVQHLGESGGAPKTSFGDATLNTGCGSNTCWDQYISSGGNMHSTAADYSVNVGQSDNGDGTSDVTVTAAYIGSGSPASTITLYAAVTEKVCNSHVYSDGSKGHNCWEAWLLDNGAYASNSGNVGGGTGFKTIALASGTSSTTWTVPNNLVNGGASNMNVVAALFSGWSTSSFNEDVYAAADGTMQPPIDVSISSFTVDNQDGARGFMSGDMLDLEVTVRNAGADTYSDGGTIQICYDNACFDSVSLNTLSNAAGSSNTQTFSTTFDTSSIVNTANGLTGFKAQVVGLTGDGNGANNVQMSYIEHDFTPSADTPIADGQTAIPRGGTLDFDVTGNARDGVDTLATMSPELEISQMGSNMWSSDWVSSPVFTAAGTPYQRYVFTVEPVNTASSGDYDVRARFTDARGQVGDWNVANDAFSLTNGLPIVVDPNQPGNAPGTCPAFPGLPTVKVETNELVSLSGLVCDAETDLTNLAITSSDPSFIAWHASTNQIEVHFDSMQWDGMGNPLPQGLGISIDDGEDINTGTLMFNVIENGQPRWSSIPAQSYDEGGSKQLSLAQFVTDSDSNGNPVSIIDLSISIVSVEPADILNAEIFGTTLMVTALDDDSYGSAVVTVRATDTDGQTSDTEVHVHVQNVNDAPRFDSTGLDNIMVQAGDTLELDLTGRLTDVDDDDAEIWATVTSNDGVVQYNPISGVLTATYQDAGEYMFQLSASDSSGATGQWNMIVNVVDSINLVWSNNGTNGDLDILVTDMYIGKNATVYLVQLSDIDFIEITATWLMCDSDSGICFDQGVIELDPSILSTSGQTFTVMKTAGGSLGTFDYIKVVVNGEGTDGFDYESSPLRYDAAPEPGSELPNTGDNNDNEDQSSGDESVNSEAGGMSGMLLFGVIGLVVLMVIAGLLGAMLLRGNREVQPSVDWGTEMAFNNQTSVTPAPAPSVAASTPAVSQSVPSYMQLTPGGQYVTGHSGETVYLSPDGTAWTMQADSSFIRTS